MEKKKKKKKKKEKRCEEKEMKRFGLAEEKRKANRGKERREE